MTNPLFGAMTGRLPETTFEYMRTSYRNRYQRESVCSNRELEAIHALPPGIPVHWAELMLSRVGQPAPSDDRKVLYTFDSLPRSTPLEFTL